MIAKSLYIRNFRNIKEETLHFHHGVNIICGENANGKTNILEALWIFSSGKSFRAFREKEMIQFDEEFSKLELDFFSNNREQHLSIDMGRKTKKALTLNGVKIKKLSEIIGNFTTVLFSPEHLTLIKDGPSERRRFVDIALCQQKPKYLAFLSDYHKLLEQRNATLKKAFDDKSYLDTLAVWDEKIALCGSEIIVMRHFFIKELLEFAKNIHSELSSQKETLFIHYHWLGKDEPTDVKEVYETYKRILKEALPQELKEGITLYGPHKDDIEIMLGGISARLFGSQGQQRSCVLSLKLAEAELIHQEYGEYPLLLLDDVLSELDQKRQEFIVEKIKDKQVIITCCEIERFEHLKAGKVFVIENGELRMENEGVGKAYLIQ